MFLILSDRPLNCPKVSLLHFLYLICFVSLNIVQSVQPNEIVGCFRKGYILFITKFIGPSPNFNDASPHIEILKLV